ncbi:MAG: amino acid adenylation domain-containing protein [Clostridiales bacterium]|nr:amino acid adenylation domain-containing protein [Candidatus Blautia equi]
MKKDILEYLEHSAECFPDKPAFEDEEKSCTFKELVEAGRVIGTELAGKITMNQPVPVLMEKSVDTIKLLMGIVYAGGFYVVMDATHPVGRLNSILETLDTDILIYEEKNEALANELAFTGRRYARGEFGKGEADAALLADVRFRLKDTDPLYGNFTSGSTGVPKGVVVSHRSVIDFIDCFTDIFDITDQDVIGNQAPWDFDVSVKDIYSGLKTGATVQVIPKAKFSIPTALLDFLDERKVTTLTWAVSALCIITTLRGFEYKIPTSIKKVLFSGEVMPMKHLNQWRQYLPDVTYVNLYGPTEITCNCTYYVVDREFDLDEKLPIGKAFPNETVFLLDEENHLITEEDKIGEICVSGTALALGYYNNWEQTNKAFVQNPLNTRYREPIYRTGDLAYYDKDRNLCFASRKDFQIKHMGHRIELGEVELAMNRVPEIIRCLCMYDEKKSKIVAFYQGDINKRDLFRALTAFLPEYMIPNAYRQVEEMPLNKNGKIDRAELKKLYFK